MKSDKNTQNLTGRRPDIPGAVVVCNKNGLCSIFATKPVEFSSYSIRLVRLQFIAVRTIVWNVSGLFSARSASALRFSAIPF